MRYISARERSVLMDLLNPNQSNSLITLSKKNNVSTRTIRRDLATIAMLLRDYQLSLQTTEDSITVLGDAQKQSELLLQIPMFDYSSVERTLLCFADLLDQTEHIKLLQLQQTLEASPVMVNKAIDELEAMVTVYGGQINRKRSAGILIQADEEAIRYISFELVLRLINQLNAVLIFEGNSISELIHPYLHAALNQIIVMDRVHKIIDQVTRYYKKESIPRDDQVILEIAVYIAVVMRRASQTRVIHVDDGEEPLHFLKEMDLSISDQNDVTQFINARLNRDLLVEIAYESKERFEVFLAELLQRNGIPRHMIHWFYDDLYQWFVKHTQTTATRIFSDELLVEVLRTDYPNEFDVLNQVVADLLPKHHFQASLAELFVLFISRLEQLLQQIELKALVVCIGGMGSSRMITTRLKNQFPRLILENISLTDTTRYDPAAFDFIISTVQSSLHPERTIKVSPLLFESDILKIKQMIRNIGLYRPHPVLNESKQDYSTIFMIRHSKAQSYEALIQESIQEHFDQGIVTNLDEVVLKIVLNAEIGFGIPETKIAIYHARAMSIKQQSVEIIYTSAIVVPSMLEGELQATTHIIMLSTEHMTENEKQLFNTISVMLTRDSEFISILQTQDINSIQQYINHNMIGEE
jgi:mannitol operon transcriptional antiterminator